jgi:hypothetical protein
LEQTTPARRMTFTRKIRRPNPHCSPECPRKMPLKTPLTRMHLIGAAKNTNTVSGARRLKRLAQMNPATATDKTKPVPTAMATMLRAGSTLQ